VEFKGKEVPEMPGFDGTGPMGGGPMTGWGRGYCNSFGVNYGAPPAGGPGYWGAGRGFGWGRGFGRRFLGWFGRGRGYGRGFGRRGGYRYRTRGMW